MATVKDRHALSNCDAWACSAALARGRLTCELRPSRHSAAPFTSSTLLPGLPGAVRRVRTPELAAGAADGAEQITLIDFLSRSNSRVASFLHLHDVWRADLGVAEAGLLHKISHAGSYSMARSRIRAIHGISRI